MRRRRRSLSCPPQRHLRTVQDGRCRCKHALWGTPTNGEAERGLGRRQFPLRVSPLVPRPAQIPRVEEMLRGLEGVSLQQSMPECAKGVAEQTEGLVRVLE